LVEHSSMGKVPTASKIGHKDAKTRSSFLFG